MPTTRNAKNAKVNLKLSLSFNPLLRVIAKYKHELSRPQNELGELLHFHEKNPDARSQIKLLENIEHYIKEKVEDEQKELARLGALLILRALLIDPNREGHVYNYLIEKLQLDEAIEKELKQMKAQVKMDLTDRKYLKLSHKAISFTNEIIDKISEKSELPQKFLQDVSSTVMVELEYLDKVLISLGSKIKTKP